MASHAAAPSGRSPRGSTSHALVEGLLGDSGWIPLQARIAEGIAHQTFRASTLTHLLREATTDERLREAVRTLIVPARSWRRRTTQDQPLSPNEVRRMTDVAEVVREARRVYGGDALAADVFLRTPRGELHNRPPMLMAAMDGGPQAVRELIGRLEDGGPA